MFEKVKIKFKTMLRQEDTARLMKNVIGNYAVKGGAMLVSLVIMPAYMHYFTSQTLLGMWFTATSILSWLMMFDFGIGGGMRNQLVAPLKNHNQKEIREILGSAFLSVGGIVVMLIIFQHFIVEMVDWYTLLGISPGDISERGLMNTMHILIIGVCIRFFSVLVSHILYAMQHATWPSLLILLTNILLLIYMTMAKPTGDEVDIINLAFVHAVMTNLPIMIALIVLFVGPLRGCFPSIHDFSFQRTKTILGTGGTLFYLQLLITFVFGVKELFISWFVGAGQVVTYQIYYKLIGMVGGLFSLALTPVWSAVTKAKVEKNYSWITSLYKRGAQILGLFGIGQILLVIMMPFIAEIWLGKNSVEVSYIYGLLFCIYNLLYMWIMMNYNFACGLGRTHVISVGLTLAMVGNIILSYFGCKLYPSWITVVVATAIAAIPCALMVWRDLTRYIKNIQEGKE